MRALVARRFEWLVLAAVTWGTACGSTSEMADDGQDGTGSSGAAPTRQEAMQMLSYVLFSTVATIYNENFVGQPAGPIDQTANCPMGGTVRFQGTLEVSKLAAGSASTSPTLKLTMAHCGASATSGQVVYDPPAGSTATGLVSFGGSWVNDSSGGVTQESATLQGRAALTGYVFVRGESVAVNEQDCQFSVTFTQHGSQWTETGSVCGVPFSHSGENA